MKKSVNVGLAALALIGAGSTAHATVLYQSPANTDVNGVTTPDITTDPGPDVAFSLTFDPTPSGGGGVVIDELAGDGSWHDAQFVVDDDGTVLASIYPYSSILTLGTASFGQDNSATFTYDDMTGLLSGLLNGVASSLAGPVYGRATSFGNAYTDVYYGIGNGDSTTPGGTDQSFAGTITNVTITADGASAAVPEPATWALMLVGFGAVGIAMRRRARVAVSYASPDKTMLQLR